MVKRCVHNVITLKSGDRRLNIQGGNEPSHFAHS